MKVYVTRQIPETGISLLKKQFDVTVYHEKKPVPPDILLKEAEDADAVLSLLSDKIDEKLFSMAKKLKIVANYAVGYNNIDIDAARKYNIPVTHTPGVLTNATSEIAFALMIALTRNILVSDQFTRDGKFVGWDPLLFLGDELRGKTIGLVGMGRIGRDMAEKCRAFGMNIIYHNRKPVAHELETGLNAEYKDFRSLLRLSDVISIHTPLTESTHHLFDKQSFNEMKEGVYIINTSRGEVIDEKALSQALVSGKVKGAGLDVYEFEPQITNELLSMKNVILLPHIGSATIETRDNMAVMAAENIISVLSGKKPLNLIPELKGMV